MVKEPFTKEVPDWEHLQAFAERGDAAAFEILMRRHGPTVLRVCRRVLGDDHAAEDAFQATFLVFLRKATSIQKRECLTGWFYRVAFRIAVRARKQTRSVCLGEAPAKCVHGADPLIEVNTSELCAIIDGEIDQLPERYRIPILLCCLKGLTRDEAAQQLGWPLRTLQRRLEQGRALLRSRLSRRGLTLSAAVLAEALAEQTVTALPTTLVGKVLAALEATGIGGSVAGAASSTVASLWAACALKEMTRAKLGSMAGVFLTVLVGGTSAGLFLWPDIQKHPKEMCNPRERLHLHRTLFKT
jgi:RNA polymerase sigma factor (sigma-70 family)